MAVSEISRFVTDLCGAPMVEDLLKAPVRKPLVLLLEDREDCTLSLSELSRRLLKLRSNLLAYRGSISLSESLGSVRGEPRSPMPLWRVTIGGGEPLATDASDRNCESAMSAELWVLRRTRPAGLAVVRGCFCGEVGRAPGVDGVAGDPRCRDGLGPREMPLHPRVGLGPRETDRRPRVGLVARDNARREGLGCRDTSRRVGLGLRETPRRPRVGLGALDKERRVGDGLRDTPRRPRVGLGAFDTERRVGDGLRDVPRLRRVGLGARDTERRVGEGLRDTERREGLGLRDTERRVGL